MIGLEFIVKLYKGTYKKLAEKLGLTTSTVTDWISGRRPIPKAKLQALSQVFQIEEQYFQKELNEVEKIQLQLDYLRRLSERDSFEVEEEFIDDEGVEQKGTRWVDPYESERIIKKDELQVEIVLLELRSSLFTELYEEDVYLKNNQHFRIAQRLSHVMNETFSETWEEETKETWLQKHRARIQALDSIMYYMGTYKKGWMNWDKGGENFANELFQLLTKYDLIWEEKKEKDSHERE